MLAGSAALAALALRARASRAFAPAARELSELTPAPFVLTTAASKAGYYYEEELQLAERPSTSEPAAADPYALFRVGDLVEVSDEDAQRCAR